MKLHSPTTKKSAALSILLTFAALLATSVRSAVVTNWMVDISGQPINRTVNFYPQSTPQSIAWNGTNVTVMDLAKSVDSTNGAWAKTFVGGLYYADFGTLNDGTRTDRVLFLVPPNDSATYDFNYCANLATNLGTFVWTNNYYVQITTNLAGNALVQVTNIAQSVSGSGGVTNFPVAIISSNGIVAAYQTNSAFNQITAQTNIVYFKNGTLFPGLNNTNFYWNQSLGSYTNALGYYLFYNSTWNGYLVQSNSSTYGSGVNFVFGDIGSQSPDINNLFGPSGFFSNFAQDVFDETLQASGSLTNAATNSLLVSQVPVKMNLATNLQTPLYIVDVNGRTLAKFIYNSNASYSHIAPFVYAETNSGAVVATNLYNPYQGGAQAYIENQASSSVDPSESRFGGGVVTLFGWGGIFGSAREYFGKWATGWPRPPWQSSGSLSLPIKFTPIGGAIIGYNAFDMHTMLELGSNGVVTIAPSWTDRPQLFFMPSPAPTNTAITGQMWRQTNSTGFDKLMLAQDGVSAPVAVQGGIGMPVYYYVTNDFIVTNIVITNHVGYSIQAALTNNGIYEIEVQAIARGNQATDRPYVITWITNNVAMGQVLTSRAFTGNNSGGWSSGFEQGSMTPGFVLATNTSSLDTFWGNRPISQNRPVSGTAQSSVTEHMILLRLTNAPMNLFMSCSATATGTNYLKAGSRMKVTRIE